MKKFLACSAVFAALLWGCDDSSSGPEQFNTETPSSVQEKVSSSSEILPPPDTTCCRIKESSSSENPLSSSSFAPVARSSSSVVALREDPEDDRYKVYRLLYPTPEGTLDTGFFAAGECTFNEDGTFKCYERSCIEDVGGRIHIPLGSGIGLMAIPAEEKDDNAYGKYFHESTEITRLVDINLGDSALTTFIPYADIPEFDTDSMQGLLATLSAKTCTMLERFVGPYQFQAEGLPEGIVLYRDGAQIEKRQTSIESYSMLFAKEELGSIKRMFRIALGFANTAKNFIAKKIMPIIRITITLTPNIR